MAGSRGSKAAGGSVAERADLLCEAALAGDRRALARLLTAVENRTPLAEAALRRLYPLAGLAQLIGVTGPPGAGKSTLVAALIAEPRCWRVDCATRASKSSTRACAKRPK